MTPSIFVTRGTHSRDKGILHKDPESLADWSKKWLMFFTVKVCSRPLHAGETRNYINIHHWKTFCTILKHYYTGIITWTDYCFKIITNPSRTLILIRMIMSPWVSYRSVVAILAMPVISHWRRLWRHGANKPPLQRSMDAAMDNGHFWNPRNQCVRNLDGDINNMRTHC